MPIKTIKFTKITKASTYYSLGGIRLYDKSNNLIEVIFDEVNKLTSNNFRGKYTGTVTTANSYSSYYFVDSPFDTSKSQKGNYNELNYWLSSSATELVMTFDEPVVDISRIEFNAFPQGIDTRKQRSVTLELLNENEKLILSKTINTDSAIADQIYSEDVSEYTHYKNFIIRDGNNLYSKNYNKPESIPAMTSNTSPAPYEVSASSSYNSTYPVWKAFNKTANGTTDSWLSKANHLNERVTIKLKEKARSNSVQIVSRDYTTNADAFPKTFTIDGSNDGVNWTTLAKLDNQSAGVKESKLYEFRNNHEYLYYSIGNMNNPNNPSIQMALGQVNFNLVPSNELIKLPKLKEEYIIKYGKYLIEGISEDINTYTYLIEKESKVDNVYSVKMKYKPLSINFKEGE